MQTACLHTRTCLHAASTMYVDDAARLHTWTRCHPAVSTFYDMRCLPERKLGYLSPLLLGSA